MEVRVEPDSGDAGGAIELKEMIEYWVKVIDRWVEGLDRGMGGAADGAEDGVEMESHLDSAPGPT